MLYTIKKGSHYPTNRCLLPCGGKNDRTSMSALVSFDDTCFYDPTVLGTDAGDINKLFGYGYGYFNTDSVRVGWRSKKDYIELFIYLHVGGKRYIPAQKSKLNYTVKKGETVALYLSNTADKAMLTIVSGDRTTSETIVVDYPHSGIAFGWEQGIYFGGNKTAPNTMYITIDKS